MVGVWQSPTHEQILRWFKDLSTDDKQRHSKQALDPRAQTYQKVSMLCNS
jgi:hypothetical protein